MSDAEDGFVLFEDETKLEVDVVYCVFCLLTDVEPRKAVTVTGGDACCGEHLFFAKSEQATFFASKFFEQLRAKNIGDEGAVTVVE